MIGFALHGFARIEHAAVAALLRAAIGLRIRHMRGGDAAARIELAGGLVDLNVIRGRGPCVIRDARMASRSITFFALSITALSACALRTPSA